MRVYTARWLLPVSAPPVRDGAVAVDESGRVAYAGPVALAPPGNTTALGDAALLPGLVAVLPDAAAAPAAGVTTVATTAPQHAAALVAADRRGIVYQPADSIAAAARDLAALRARLAPSAGRLRAGLAVPPVYDLDEDTLLDLCAWAVGENAPLAIAAGATAAEVAFLREASGPHADALRARGVDVVRRAHSTVHLLAELGVAAVARPLLVGGAFFDESDVALAAYYDCPVAYAPPAHAPDGSPDADPGLAALLAANARVALAAPDPLAAALALGLPPDVALHLATLGAARALGLDAEVGSLEPGKWADLRAFALTAAELQLAELLGPHDAVAAAAQRRSPVALAQGAELRPRDTPPLQRPTQQSQPA